MNEAPAAAEPAPQIEIPDAPATIGRTSADRDRARTE